MNSPSPKKQGRISMLPALLAGLFFAILVLAASCDKSSAPSNDKPFAIGVFVPGVVAGSPTYEMMVDGVNKAVADLIAKGRQASVKIVEGGYNQGDWLSGLTAMAAESRYDLLVSSNASMPDLAVKVLESFPKTHFLLMDASLNGNPQIKTIGFDQYQQAFLNGRLASLLLDPAKAHRIGLLAGQEYPVMDNEIKVGFLDGAKSRLADAELEFRVLGNWYDPAKAEELALSMTDKGAQVILTIAGGGNQGVVNAASKSKTAVTWFDSPGYSFGPGVVKGGTVVSQTEFCRNGVLAAANGSLDYGVATVNGIVEGAVGYAFGPELEASLGSPAYKELSAWFESLTAQGAQVPRKP